MFELRKKLIALTAGATVLLGGFCFADAQVRTVRVYRSSTYNRTRTLMSNRAAVKKVLKKNVKKRRHTIKKRR